MTDAVAIYVPEETPPAKWGMKIVGYSEEDPSQLLANPRNQRVHPRSQMELLKSLLGDVGWVAPVLVNRFTGFVLDGHARVKAALEEGESSVPVAYVELTPAQELKMLTLLDYTTGLAGIDASLLAQNIADISADELTAEEQLALRALAEDNGIFHASTPNPPTEGDDDEALGEDAFWPIIRFSAPPQVRERWAKYSENQKAHECFERLLDAAGVPEAEHDEDVPVEADVFDPFEDDND